MFSASTKKTNRTTLEFPAGSGIKIKNMKYQNYSEYCSHVFEANGFLFRCWIDHCGNVMDTKRIRKA